MQPLRWFALFFVAISLVLQAIAQDSPLTVITTTTIIADIARNVGSDLVDVTSLVPPGADTHSFQARPSDMVLLSEADIVLANGLGLEGFLADILEAANVTPVIVTADIVPSVHTDHDEDEAEHDENEVPVCEANEAQIEATEEAHEHGECDPHVWGNPNNVMLMADTIAAAFTELDPDNAAVYQANADTYKAELEALDAEIAALFTDIPVKERLIVTNHDFLGYFAEHYGFTVIGTVIPGISTLAEPNPRELAALSQQIEALGVKAIFVEFSATEDLSGALVAEIGDSVQIVELYSESLSEADGVASTYLDYMRYNAQAIAAVFNS
jgi:zinc/manganese transport system substrate-binding protein